MTNGGEWAALCSVLDRPDLVSEPRFQCNAGRHLHQDSIDPIIEEWTLQHERYQAMAFLQAAGVPAGAVLDQDEALSSPQAKSRGFLTTLTRPDGKQQPYINMRVQFSRTPAGVRGQGPLLGEHNSYVLGNSSVCHAKSKNGLKPAV
ncbi:MAG: CoA transferase [Chloroflexi bacterium]|nr:CoA transferase [Chloroflexota bacterium]